MVPKRFKFFIWLFIHDMLFANINKSKKGMRGAGCNLCGNVCGCTMHVFRDCPKAMQIWMN